MFNIRLISDKNRLYSLCFSLRSSKSDRLLVNKILGKSTDTTFFDQGTEGYDVSNLIISKHKGGATGIANVATGIKSEGDAVISGTKGHVYIPEPWWLTKKFHVRYEDESKNKTFNYEFNGCGLRYMIAEFTSLIQRGVRKSEMLTPRDMRRINKVLLKYNERKIKELEDANNDL